MAIDDEELALTDQSKDEAEKRQVEDQLDALEKAEKAIPRHARGKLRAQARRELVVQDCRERWQKRFGQPWRDEDAKWVTGAFVREAAQRECGLGRCSPRTAFVAVIDRLNGFALPPRADGSSYFLSVTEKTWASLLAGNWPKRLRRGATAADVFRAEFEAVKKAAQRYPLTPLVAYEGDAWYEHPVRRGRQVRDNKRLDRLRRAAEAGDWERVKALQNKRRRRV